MHYKMKPLCDYNSYFNWVTLTSMAKEYKSLVSYCVLCTHAVLTAVLQFDFESEEGHEQNDAKLKEPPARTHPPPHTHTHTLQGYLCHARCLPPHAPSLISLKFSLDHSLSDAR